MKNVKWMGFGMNPKSGQAAVEIDGLAANRIGMRMWDPKSLFAKPEPAHQRCSWRMK